MTPEEAKSRDGYAGQYSDASEKWFTAKETAEIAKAYAESYRQCDLYCVGVCEQRPDCVNKFDKNLEWWRK